MVYTFQHWQFFLCACGAAGRQQGVSSDGSAVPALGSDSGSNIRSSIYQLVVGSRAYRRDRSVGRSQAYQRDQYRNSRHSGAISLSMVCGSAVPVQGRFRRRIGTNSCLSSGNSSFMGRRLISITIIGITGVSAQSFSRLDCRRSTVIVWLGSSTVLATGSFGWQYNASNGVVFRRQISTESYR